MGLATFGSSLAALCCLLASVAAAEPGTVSAGSPAPFINTWLVAGTFENDSENAGYERDWIGEATVEPREGMVSSDREWCYFDDRLFSRNYDDYQDLFSYFKAERFESVAAKAMAEVGDACMPTAFRAWPYVGLDPLSSTDPVVESYVRRKPHIAVHASPFTLAAQGGTPAYHWTLVDGALPPGLTLGTDGTISGVVDETAAFETYAFTVRVTDNASHEAQREISIRVRERPNKWYEEARLLALIHNPESMLDATTAQLRTEDALRCWMVC